ncbi:hypothetical protein BDZ89DRAFT_1067247 [Hymenopellis radicata]|nr:hypothetical protein BDZ89DRAFT_1067247 [Hymenopellis radicata]
MSATFKDYGYTVPDVQAVMSATLHPVILLVFCHGIHTCISFDALYHIAQSAHRSRRRIIFASIISFLWCANTIIVGLLWREVDEGFIVHGISLEAEFDYFFFGDLPAGLVQTILRVLAVFLTDLILIWRCWALYGGDLRIVAAPSLCLITETVSVCLVLFYSVNGGSTASESQEIWTQVYYSMTVVTNSLCTFLILFRIMKVKGVGASLRTYRGIIEILVESAAMYSAIYIALLGVHAYETYSHNVAIMAIHTYPQLLSVSITGIAPTLIITRVMAGKSCRDDSWQQSSLPHAGRNMRSVIGSLRFASAPNHATRMTTMELDLETQAVHDERDEDGEARGVAALASFAKSPEAKL